MRVLALDTTTREGSAALVEDGRLIAVHRGDPVRSHAERLPGELVSLLSAAGVTTGDVDVFAVAAGPGSFTGLRIGIATMQGLAFVHGRPLVAVSALEALAHAGSCDLAPGSVVGVWMDAHRRDVFGALYQVTDAPAFTSVRLVEIDPPSVDAPAVTLARWAPLLTAAPVLVGDGCVKYADLIGGLGAIVAPPPLAGAIARIAESRARSGEAPGPDRVQPLYVRRPDAELAREPRV
jgi:tRNA threonylcarbamoyladenosine biosynthesis protein TsaB